MELVRLTEWFRQPQRILWGAVVVLGLLLWGPDLFVTGLGLREWIDDNRPFIGIAFLATLMPALGNALHFVWEQGQREWRRRMSIRAAVVRLRDLTEDEKAVLRGYIENNSRTRNLEMNDGVTSSLVSAGIIYQASKVSRGLLWFPYNVQQWSWDYLRENPDVLKDARD